jgi:hypothetical protein
LCGPPVFLVGILSKRMNSVNKMVPLTLGELGRSVSKAWEVASCLIANHADAINSFAETTGISAAAIAGAVAEAMRNVYNEVPAYSDMLGSSARSTVFESPTVAHLDNRAASYFGAQIASGFQKMRKGRRQRGRGG